MTCINLINNASFTDNDVRTYERDGVVCLRGVLSEKEINLLRDGYTAQYNNRHNSLSSYDFEDMQRQAFSNGSTEFDMGASERFDMELLKLILETDEAARPIRDMLPDGSDDDAGEFFHDAAGWRFHSEIREVAFHSKLPEIVSRLMRSNETRFWEDTSFGKAPLTPQRTVFHQDWAYFQIDGGQCCVVWIPLDIVDAKNGRMEYVRGSHLNPKIYAPNVLFAQSASPMSRSCGNISPDRYRRAFSFRYCGENIRYFDKPGAIEQQYLTGDLKNGDRLSGSDYPLVWSKGMGVEIPVDTHSLKPAI